MILVIVALVVGAETARPSGMSESGIETMSWQEWVGSFGLVDMGDDERRKKNARQFARFRMLDAINRNPLGVVAA
jgi:hypothetical protein